MVVVLLVAVVVTRTILTVKSCIHRHCRGGHHPPQSLVQYSPDLFSLSFDK